MYCDLIGVSRLQLFVDLRKRMMGDNGDVPLSPTLSPNFQNLNKKNIKHCWMVFRLERDDFRVYYIYVDCFHKLANKK